MQTPPKTSFFQSNTAKLIMIGILSLVLLIPLALVQNLISERAVRKRDMVQEVNTLWGSDIKFYGPMLSIPYYSTETTQIVNANSQTVTQTKRVIKNAYFFPEKLHNKSTIKKSKPLKRGLYENVVFTSLMDFEGSFGIPNFEKFNISAENIIWEKASIIVNTSNLKSIKSDLNISLNNEKFVFESRSSSQSIFGILESNTFAFRIHISLAYNRVDEPYAMPQRPSVNAGCCSKPASCNASSVARVAISDTRPIERTILRE